MTEEIEKRSSADVVYYGKTFRPYGKKWVEVGLRDYIPLNILVKVITKNIPNDPFKAHSTSLPKDKVVDIMMQIYNKGNNQIKQRIEKWVYSYRFQRKVKTEMPFLRRLDSFYMYLRTNPFYVISVAPDAATKVMAHLTITGISDLYEIKSVLKSILCKKKSDWDAFDSLFNTWFESTSKSYGVSSKTKIAPSAYLRLEISPESSLTVDQALEKLRRVLTGNPEVDSDADKLESEPPIYEEPENDEGEPEDDDSEEDDDNGEPEEDDKDKDNEEGDDDSKDDDSVGGESF